MKLLLVCSPGIVLGTIIFSLAGCASEQSRESAILETALKNKQERDASPETTVWLQNRTGEPIREVGMSCKSVEPANKKRSFGTTWTRETTVDGEPKEIWREKYPDPIVLETLWVRYDKGARCEYIVNHRCQPGDKVVIVIDVGGRVSVQSKE